MQRTAAPAGATCSRLARLSTSGQQALAVQAETTAEEATVVFLRIPADSSSGQATGRPSCASLCQNRQGGQRRVRRKSDISSHGSESQTQASEISLTKGSKEALASLLRASHSD